METINVIYEFHYYSLMEAIWKAYKRASHPLYYAFLSKKEIFYFLSFSLSFIISIFSILFCDLFFPIIYYYQCNI